MRTIGSRLLVALAALVPAGLFIACAVTQPGTQPAKVMASNPANSYENKVAELYTTAGEIDIRFMPDIAPNHVKNFIDLAKRGFYDNTKFHRVIPEFMIQGGDPNTTSDDKDEWGKGGSDTTVNAEFSDVPHKRGIVSMARAADPNSATSQFFIMVGDAPFLDHKYSVFGAVTKGMDVVDKIVSAERNSNDLPYDPVSITRIVIREARRDETVPAKKQARPK
jgi:cyclophilin family peptidyl-prolyl cis-trans isomerase